MQYISVKNWDDFQHYKDRTPPWIKLHRTLLDDYAFSCLQDASKAHLMLIWVLASQLENKIPNDPDWIAKKIGVKERVDVKSLIKAGFLLLHDASGALANCSPETEEESEKETEREESPLPPTDDLQVCVDLWNDTAARLNLPACQRLSDTRRKALQARLKECDGLEGWKAVLEIVASSDFLSGRKTDFKATIDFLLQKSSFQKVMEGNYNNHKPSQGRGMSYFDEVLEAGRQTDERLRKAQHDDPTDNHFA